MGMDVERFVDVNPELICSICHEVLDNPMETPCRHIYCSSCIYNWVNRSITRENNCPTCRTKVRHDSIRPALPIIKNILAKQKMHCDCFARGCKEVVTMEKMKQHLEVCPYQPIPCCHDECSALVMRKNIEKHERSCVKRKVVCPIGCGSLVVFEEAHNHGCVSILKRQLDENLKRFDDKITFIKEKYNSLEERLQLVEQGHKNSNSQMLVPFTDQMLGTLKNSSQRNIEVEVKKVEKELQEFTKNICSCLHQRLCHGLKKMDQENKTMRRSKRNHRGHKDYAAVRDRSRSPFEAKDRS